MGEETEKCAECDHPKHAHEYEPGFYDVRSKYARCDYIGCPCLAFRSKGKT